MSVINQMLRDLDARAAGAGERIGLPPHLRTLPPNSRIRQQNWRMLAIGIGVGAFVAGGLVALLLRNDPVPPSAPPVPPAVAPALPLAPVPESVPPASTSGISSGKPAAPIDLAEMKLSTLLSLAQQPLPEKPAVAKPAPPAPVAAPVPSPVVPKAPEPVVAKPAPVPPPATVPAKPAEPPRPVEPPKAPVPAKPLAAPRPEPVVAEAQIDKRARGGQASEMAEAEYRKGMQAVKRGDNAAAVPLFQRALELDPALAKSRQALLSVLVGGRHWIDAQRVAQAGLALDPGQSGWAMILARLQFEQGDAAGALETLARHAAHAQNDADYQGLFAYLLQKQQRPAEAAERFKAAVTLRPSEGRWWFGLGLALEGAGRAGEAREAFLKARETGSLPGDMNSVVDQKLR